MASRKSFLTNQSYYQKSQEGVFDQFEFDEAELWNSCNSTTGGEAKKGGGAGNNSMTGSRSGLKRSTRKVGQVGPASLPMNIPDWPKILKGDYKQHRKWESDDDDDDDGGDENEGVDHDHGIRIPPHEYLARTRGASLSVHEGIGRTLKGRDLCSVRNAIWKKVGFED